MTRLVADQCVSVYNVFHEEQGSTAELKTAVKNKSEMQHHWVML